MRVTVRLMGPYKRAAGVAGDVAVEPDEPTLGGVVRAIGARHPEAARKLAPAQGKLEAGLRVVLNDVVLQSPTWDDAVRDGDRVAFVPIVGGGL